jgi:hypothetical protein
MAIELKYANPAALCKANGDYFLYSPGFVMSLFRSLIIKI